MLATWAPEATPTAVAGRRLVSSSRRAPIDRLLADLLDHGSRGADDGFLHVFGERRGPGAAVEGLARLVATLLEHAHRRDVAEHVVGIRGDPEWLPFATEFSLESQRVIDHDLAGERRDRESVAE